MAQAARSGDPGLTSRMGCLTPQHTVPVGPKSIDALKIVLTASDGPLARYRTTISVGPRQSLQHGALILVCSDSRPRVRGFATAARTSIHAPVGIWKFSALKTSSVRTKTPTRGEVTRTLPPRQGLRCELQVPRGWNLYRDVRETP